MNKIVGLALLSCWFGLGSYAQAAENGRQLFNNDSIKFELLWISPSVESMAKKTKTGTFVELYLPKYVRDSLLKNDQKFWIDHLVGDSTDWATNLVLYYLHQRDAKLIQMLYPNREMWVSEKDREINYWSNFLFKHGYKK